MTVKVRVTGVGYGETFQLEDGAKVSDLHLETNGIFDRFTLNSETVSEEDLLVDGGIYLGTEESQKVSLGS